MLFSDFPDEARVWIYPLSRALTAEEQATLTTRLNTFAEGWTSHQRPVLGATAVLHDRFLVLTARIIGGDISGCGIDKSVHAVESAVANLEAEVLPVLSIFYADAAGDVHAVSRGAFRKLVQAGTVDATTKVFDPSLTLLGDLRRGAFAQTAGESWHGRIFRIPQPAT